MNSIFGFNEHDSFWIPVYFKMTGFGVKRVLGSSIEQRHLFALAEMLLNKIYFFWGGYDCRIYLICFIKTTILRLKTTTTLFDDRFSPSFCFLFSPIHYSFFELLSLFGFSLSYWVQISLWWLMFLRFSAAINLLNFILLFFFLLCLLVYRFDVKLSLS